VISSIVLSPFGTRNNTSFLCLKSMQFILDFNGNIQVACPSQVFMPFLEKLRPLCFQNNIIFKA
jgi:hypothetical protein